MLNKCTHVGDTMSELDYLEKINNYRNEVHEQALHGIDEILSFYLSVNFSDDLYIPSVILKEIDLRRKLIFSFYDEKDRASWQLEPFSQKYGAWFENAPLEIAPQLPNQAPTETLLELIRKTSEWAFNSNKFNHQKIFDTLFEVSSYYQSSASDRQHRQWLGLYLLSLVKNPWERDILYKQSLDIHPDAQVRALILSLCFFDLPWVAAEEYLYACTHDTDEVVFIKAFRIIARIHDERAMDHLRPIVNSPSAILKALAKNNMYYPVGHAACNICPAQFAIIGTDNPELAEIRENELKKRIRRPLSVPVEHQRENILIAIKNFKQPEINDSIPNDFNEMIKIPKGEFIFGIDECKIQNEVFDWSTCTPPQEMELDDFYIDPYPVTNAEYDQWEKEFSSFTINEKEKYEHPGQKKEKLHRRNTFDDPRFQQDHPVVGIDWFDAWAYARSHNKEIPTEYQWEKAAKGDTTWKYPWGDHFDPEALRFADETYNIAPNNIIEWIILLNRGTKNFPPSTTSSVKAHSKGKSPYGLFDMCGNAWEFTKTSFFTKENARLPFAKFTPVELMGTREGHVVIRGGAWSSPASLIGSSYRGFDLLTDRHTEISFRCVYNPK